MRLESITLHGFKSFAERTEVKVLPGISCVVGPNGCGKSNLYNAVFLLAKTASGGFARVIAEGKAQGRYFTPDPHPESGGFYRSDHFSFAKQGVPAISFKPGDDLVTGGIKRGEALDADYTAKRYHQPDDEFNPQWDFRGMAQDAYLLHQVGERLANSREWPNWSADSEFRATRDKSADERSNAVPAPAPKKGERG